jgi:cyclophilin family peptidyl-prolyl cis-trans isomerase
VIFGNVVRGLEVMDALATVETTMGGDGAMSKPLSPLRIQKVTIRP